MYTRADTNNLKIWLCFILIVISKKESTGIFQDTKHDINLTGLDQFFLSQNVQFEAFILLLSYY